MKKMAYAKSFLLITIVVMVTSWCSATILPVKINPDRTAGFYAEGPSGYEREGLTPNIIPIYVRWYEREPFGYDRTLVATARVSGGQNSVFSSITTEKDLYVRAGIENCEMEIGYDEFFPIGTPVTLMGSVQVSGDAVPYQWTVRIGGRIDGYSIKSDGSASQEFSLTVLAGQTLPFEFIHTSSFKRSAYQSNVDIEFSIVPEPSTVVLFCLGSLAMGWRRRKS